MKLMTKTMMTYSRDQVSGGCRGLVVIGRHAQANRDLKHDEANGRDDEHDGEGDDDEEEDGDGNEDEASDNDDWACSNWKTRPTKPRPKNMMKLMVGKMLKTTPNQLSDS